MKEHCLNMRYFQDYSVAASTLVNIIALFVCCVCDNRWRFITVNADTVDGLLITATVPVLDRFGWTTYSAVERREVSQIVVTVSGAIKTVNTKKTSRSHATLLLQTVCNSTWKGFICHCEVTSV